MTDPPKKRYLPGLLSESLQRPKARGFVYSPTSPVLYQGLRRWARATGRSLAFGALLTLSRSFGVETSSRRPATTN